MFKIRKVLTESPWGRFGILTIGGKEFSRSAGYPAIWYGPDTMSEMLSVTVPGAHTNMYDD